MHMAFADCMTLSSLPRLFLSLHAFNLIVLSRINLRETYYWHGKATDTYWNATAIHISEGKEDIPSPNGGSRQGLNSYMVP